MLDSMKRTPTFLSRLFMHQEVTEYLKSQGGQLFTADNEETTEFFNACIEGEVERVVKLLETCTDDVIKARDICGMSALDWASSMGQKEIVRILLEEPQLKCDASDIDGSRPIHYADNFGHRRTCREPLSTLWST